MACQICGAKDLYSEVTQEPVCGVCAAKFLKGFRPRSERIALIRERLGLEPGEMLKQDCAQEARKILGR